MTGPEVFAVAGVAMLSGFVVALAVEALDALASRVGRRARRR